MRTINEFKKDFAMELEEGMLYISDTLSEQTIFILGDGTIINAEFNEYGDRCTDHRRVLSDSRYSIDDLVTIEPESQTIILPDNGTTQEQDNALLDIDQVYNCYDLYVLYSNSEHIEQAVIMLLLSAGATWETAYLTGVQHAYTQYTVDEYEKMDETEKDELVVIDDDIIVYIW